MVRLREIPRTATFAWSPGSGLPLIATGTKAGAVDADFSSDTQLELWSLELQNAHQSLELQPSAVVATDSRFHDIAWVKGRDSDGKGIIAGALENGCLDLWDAEKLLRKDRSNSIISRTTKHTGAIKALQFNSFRSELLATAGAKGELFISDLNNVANPFRLGNTAVRADDFDCLDWNKKVPHILVTGSNGGFVTVWDVKSKKESLTLNNFGRKAVSSVVWDPEKPTRVITAVPLDTDPLILVWDLRNSNTPEKVTLFSLQDLKASDDLSSYKAMKEDNRTICWDPQTGQAYGEFPVVTNWTFQTKWNPHNPGLLATASFDGKISIQTIQNTKADSSQSAPAQALDGEDFFDKVRSQPQVASFSLQKPPKWLQRPCGVSFGFGGKIVKFNIVHSDVASSLKSEISISDFVIDGDIEAMTETFAKAMGHKDLKNVCETRIGQATLESEKTDWRVIETLIAENPRKELINYLGISNAAENASEKSGQKNGGVVNDQSEPLDDTSVSRKTGLSAFFEAGQDGDNFLNELASTKGAKTNNPFDIYSDSESEAEKRIIQALLLGNFESAMDCCLAEDRLSDAFMIAICGGQTCMEKVQKAYFKGQAAGPRYLRLLASIVGKNLWDVVYNANLQNWREVMATLCTYASAEEFPDLCEALGDRLEDESRDETTDHSHTENASFCYIAGSKLEKVVGVWIAELEYNEERSMQESANGSSFSIHARSLQNFIEKVTVFREVTRYQDKDLSASGNWKLAALYEKYIEYADIIAAHGQLRTAEGYLDLLPTKYPAADVARNRVRQATRKAAPVPNTRQSTTTTGAFVPSRPAFEESQPHVSQTSRPYAPSNLPQPSVDFLHKSHVPQATSTFQPLQPAQAPFSRPIVAPPPSFGTPNQGAPRGPGVSSGVAPPSRALNMSNWNDTPEEFFKPSTSRRGTPGAAPPVLNSSHPTQPFSSSSAPPVAVQPLIIPKATPAPPPPPPKGPAPPPRTQTPQMGQVYQQQPPERPSSSAANIYSPPPAYASGQQQAQTQRGPSPYNPPPSSMQPGPGRYAPASGTSQQSAPPPQVSRPPPPPNPFASRHTFTSPQENSYASSIGSAPGASLGPSTNTRGEATQPPEAQKPLTPKYPPGDRSHIPLGAQQIYELLGQDMRRVKAKAPASFKTHVIDTERRLNLLFDHLNNETLLTPDTIKDMNELAGAINAKDYEKAMSIHKDLITNKTEQCGNWMVGVKRLISMSGATP
ncbi:MAG: hypothetical protein LQ340_005763 [Diploschistes diacapsis]|nr:MAG: hypothetical protein LQ340_005763 [Diploschistes diacapsis]